MQGLRSAAEMVTLKVRASLLSGCLQMMTTQTMHSKNKMVQGVTMLAWPASSSGRKFARMMHRMVMRSATVERTRLAT